MRKRGQLNIYLIFGILIIAVALLIVYYQERLFLTTWDLERITAARVPGEAKEVNDYVMGCLEEVGSEGATLLGVQGGYIELPPDEYGGRSPVNRFSNALEIIPGSEMETAYWFYEAPNGVQRTEVPTREEMEAGLASFVRNNLAACTQNFTLFENYNITTGDIEVEADILDTRVLLSVRYPLFISTADFEHMLSRFYLNIESRLGKLHGLASDILDAEMDRNFLEEKTIDILTVYEDVPYSGTDTECQPEFWLKQDVEDALKVALFSNIPFIKMKGTDFVEREAYFVEDASLGGASDVKVQLLYSESWPLEMEVGPSEGDVLVAEPILEQGIEELALVSSVACVRDYSFIYDIKYPVLMVLSDDSGTVFQFATVVVIDNNQPRENTEGLPSIVTRDDRICGNKVAGQTVEALAPDDTGRYRSVAGADISLKCVTTECDIGKTGRGGTLAANFPQCYNALLTAEKSGFHTGRETVSTIEEGSMSVVLEPYYSLDVEVKMVDYGMVRQPNSDEDYIITITEPDKRFVEVITRDTDRVSLIAGDYDVRSQAFSESEAGIEIEGRKVERCITMPQKGLFGIFGLTEERCFSANVPDITLDRVIKGGADYSWDLEREDVVGAGSVVFYIPVTSTPSTLEEMEDAYALEETPKDLISPLVE